MLYRKCTIGELERALWEVNKKYDDNIEFNRHPNTGGFTLKVKDSHGPGARLGVSGLIGYGNTRHLINACWHVHGDFFDCLFNINPDAVIISQGRRITIEAGNWEDSNIGSVIYPVHYSEACECS